jgi:hypothetical protein
MKSKEVNFTLDYTPKFIKKPTVMEKVASPNSRARNIRAIHPYTSTTPAPTTEPFLAITILWDLSYIDFPICLDRVEFQYLNIQWDESSFTETFNNPKNRMFFVVNNKKLPCDEEFSFTAKAFGVNGNIIYLFLFCSCSCRSPHKHHVGPTKLHQHHPSTHYRRLNTS